MIHKNNRETLDGKPSKFDRSVPGHPNHVAHIIQSKYQDGSYGLRGILHDDQGHAVPGAPYREATAHDESGLERAIRGLISRISSDIPAAKAPRKRSTAKSTAPAPDRYQSAFLAVKADPNVFPTWGESTRHSALMWAERHFVPMLGKHYAGENVVVIGGSKLSTWKAEQLSAISSHGRSRGNDTAATTFNRHCRECLDIYQQMRLVDFSLPSIAENELYAGAIRVEVEQFKAIPEDCRQRLYRKLESLASTEPKFTFATTIMVCGFTRTSEAAAVLPSGVDYRGDYAIIPILSQEKGGKRTPILKSENAYRQVVITRWGVTVLRDCVAHMADIPADASNEALVLASELSSWILDLLVQCSIDKALIAAAERASALFPDKTSDGLISRDIAAYILRRDGASRMQDYAGFSQEQLDLLLGHKLQKGGR